MSMKERLDADLKQAMKARESKRVECIRMLKSKILEKEVEMRAAEGKQYTITDELARQVIGSYAKQRRDSIESYSRADREDLAAAEREELELVSSYLPAQMDDAQLRGIVEAVIAESGATSIKEMGQVMKRVMARSEGAADGKRINAIVREFLA